MRKRLSLLLCTLLLVFGINGYLTGDFTGGGAFGAIANYLKVLNTNIIPSADSTYNLGSGARRFKEAHIATLAVDAITTSEDFNFSQDNPNILGNDTDGALSITADTAINQGGNVKLYGNTHGTLAGDIEFYSGVTLVLSYDLSETNWDFDGEAVIGMGALGVDAITTTDDLTFSNANPSIIGGDTDGIMSLTADTAINQGGNIKLYGNTHASLAGDIELYTDGTMVLSYDLTETTWDFDGENVGGMGVLTLPSAGLHLLDTGADHDLIITYNEDATQDNTLTILLSDANRSLTLSGSYTFDQSVASGADAVFGDVTLDSAGCGQALIDGVGLAVSAASTMPGGTTAARHGYFAGNITELAGATITDIVGLYLNSFTITDGGGGETVALVSTLYIHDAPTVGTTPSVGPYAMYVANGPTVIGGSFAHGSEAVTPTDGGIVASLVKTVTIMTSEDDEADADAISLGDGTIGQIKIFIFKTETNGGDTIVLTPDTPVGFATITFDDVGDTCTLIFDGTSWVIISTNGTT